MIQPIQIRNVEIGSGVPKVIVPIVGKTEEAILAKAGEIASMPIHTVEWRVDFYDDVFDTEKTLATLTFLKKAIWKRSFLLYEKQLGILLFFLPSAPKRKAARRRSPWSSTLR